MSDRGQFKKKLHARETVIGTCGTVPGPMLVDVLGHAGLDFVMIDTIELCGNTRDIKHASDSNEVLLTPQHDPLGPDNMWAAEVQWDWINTQLATSKCVEDSNEQD